MPISITKIYILLIILLAGCNLQNKESEVIIQNKLSKQLSVENQDDLLFDGKVIKIAEDEKGSLKSLPVLSKKSGKCFVEIGKKIQINSTNLSYKNNTEYHKFNPQENIETEDNEVSSMTNRFVIHLNKEQFNKLNIEQLQKLDLAISYTGRNDLFYIKNGQYEYLLAIGHSLAASGISSQYNDYFVFSLNGGNSTLEFS